jgi:hypothetical protein
MGGRDGGSCYCGSCRQLVRKKSESDCHVGRCGRDNALNWWRTTTTTLLALLVLLPFGTSFRGMFPQRAIHGEVPISHNIRKNFHQRRQSSSSSSTPSFDQVATEWSTKLGRELKEVSECVSMVVSAIVLSPDQVQPEDIVRICDVLDDQTTTTGSVEKELEQDVAQLVVSQRPFQLRIRALKTKRYEYLVKLMQSNYDAYVATASFLSPSRIPRRELPNLQDVPMDKNAFDPTQTQLFVAEDGVTPLVADCVLVDKQYNDNILDKILLSIFRKLVTKNTGGIASEKPGIEGLLEQGRIFLLQPGQTPEAQHKMVYDTLAGLMTPVLPPFYRIFMSGAIPKPLDSQERQLGPWFYAPFLTSFVTPTFFGFLVGPSYPNRRKDGQLGGLVVEKCKFLVCFRALQVFVVFAVVVVFPSHISWFVTVLCFVFCSKRVGVRVFAYISANYRLNNSFKKN